MMIKELLKKYGEWRRATEEAIEDCDGSVDCGEAIVREDFSDYIGLQEEISFEDMLVLELEYEYLLKKYKLAIEMLEEMGYYNTRSIHNIKAELKNLKTLGYNCYFDSNMDQIVLDR